MNEASIWGGILLMAGVMAINAASLFVYGRRQHAAPANLTRANIGFDLLLMLWELRRGQVAWAGTWFGLAILNYYVLRQGDPPEGKSLRSRLRVPRWAR